jgi:hypothetical protein
MFLDCFEPVLHYEAFEDDGLDACPGTAVEDCGEAASKLDSDIKDKTTEQKTQEKQLVVCRLQKQVVKLQRTRGYKMETERDSEREEY